MKIRPIKAIRLMVKATQEDMAEAMGCTQVNVSLYERGQSVPQVRAQRVIAFAAARGVSLTMGMIYGTEALPMAQRERVMGVTL